VLIGRYLILNVKGQSAKTVPSEKLREEIRISIEISRYFFYPIEFFCRESFGSDGAARFVSGFYSYPFIRRPSGKAATAFSARRFKHD